MIRRTGYTPNVAARSLVSGRSGVIGLVIPSRVHSLFEDPYLPRLIQGISAASNQSGTTLSLFLFQNEEEESELYPRVVTSGFLDGLIITAKRMADPLLARMTGGEMPVVIVGRPEVEGISYVDADNVGARTAAEHLCKLGYERIGLLGAPVSTTAGVDRLSGFIEGLALHGKALHPNLRVDGDFSEVSGYRAMQDLIPARPDAVFVASDTMAIGAIRALRDKGLGVPDDVALVSFDGLPASENAQPRLTTIRQPVLRHRRTRGSDAQRPGHRAAQAPIVEIMPVHLVVRESCGASRLPRVDRAF